MERGKKDVLSDVCIVVFGPVAAGKSSLVREVALSLAKTTARNVRVRVLEEPTEFLRTSGQLEKLKNNETGAALALQLSTLFARLRVSQNTAKASHEDGPRVRTVYLCDGHGDLDGHLYLSEHVRAGRLKLEDLTVYFHAKDVAASLEPIAALRNPDLFVYLRASSATCAAQCKARGRAEEGALDESFFARMIKSCNDAAMMRKERCLVVDADADSGRSASAAVASEIRKAFFV